MSEALVAEVAASLSGVPVLLAIVVVMMNEHASRLASDVLDMLVALSPAWTDRVARLRAARHGK